MTASDYRFILPPLDRKTYNKLRQIKADHQISQHGLVTIAIHLLHARLYQGNEDLKHIQEATGVKSYKPDNLT